MDSRFSRYCCLWEDFLCSYSEAWFRIFLGIRRSRSCGEFLVKSGEPGVVARGVQAGEEVKESGFIGSLSEVRGEGGLGGLELGFGVSGVIGWRREGRGGHGDLEEASLVFQAMADFLLTGFMRARRDGE